MHHHVLIGADVIEQEGEAGLGIADDFLPAAECGQCRSAFIAVQVDNKVVLMLSQTMGKAQDAEKTPVPSLLIDQQAFVDILIFLHNVREDPIREQRDACLGIIVPQRAQDGRHEHEIAEMHEVDDEYVVIASGRHSKSPLRHEIHHRD